MTLDGGFLMGVGFRVGQAGLGDRGTSLVGADVAIGFQHRFGHFLPFIKGVFGINSYDVPGVNIGHQNDLRLDAVVGSRLYVSQTHVPRRRRRSPAAAIATAPRSPSAATSIQVFHRGVMP